MSAINTTVVGTRVYSTTSGESVDIAANADGVEFLGGLLDDAAPVTGAGGTRVRFRGVGGYVTENSGTGSIASGTTADVITHGLDVTPTIADISITLAEDPTASPGAIWVDTIGAANFTVNCENDPGASNLDFGWRAVVL